MIVKVNQFMGSSAETFPKTGRVAGSKADIVEIQKGERNLLREILGIEDDMELSDMKELALGQEVWVVCQSQTRTIASLGNQGTTIDSEPALDKEGDEIDGMYIVPAYSVNVVSHIASSLQDAIATEPNAEDLKAFVADMELRTSDKTANLADKLAKQHATIAENAAKAAADRKATNAAKLAAFKAKNANRPAEQAPANVEPVLDEATP